jgi:diacylglycerol O-acyltransferase
MQQLTPLDTMFLMNESPRSSQYVTDILIFEADGPGLSLSELRRLLSERLHLLPPLRRRLVEVPFGLDEPFWVEDPDFDLDKHLYEHRLPSPGDDVQLAELTAFIAAVPLNRSRPLWELHLVHGLHEGRTALIKKFHHVALDGASSLEVTTILLDSTPEPRQVPPPLEPWIPDRLPCASELMMHGFAGMAQRPMRMLEAQRRLATHLNVHHPLAGNPPRTPFNVRVSGERSVAFEDVPLSRIRAVTSAFGVTVNDVIVSMCATVLRGWLIERNALPPRPLVVCIPISVRTEAERGSFGNRVSILIATLPTQVSDPVQRLKAIHESVVLAKNHHDFVGANVLGDMGQVVMPAMQARLSRLMTAMAWPTLDQPMHWNIAISSLPGPDCPLYLSGHRLRTHYPVGMLMDNQALMIAAASYLDKISFGLVADPHVVPDLWEMAARLPASLDELVNSSLVASPPIAPERDADHSTQRNARHRRLSPDRSSV